MEIKKLPQSTLELRGEVPTEIFESFREVALGALGKEVKLPGFRPGHVPNDVLTREIGEHKVLERMAELALSNHYPKILAENKIDALGRPSISITKLAKGNPLGFIITTAIHPEIKLPDYLKLAKEFNGKGDPSVEGSPLVTNKRRLGIIEKIMAETPIDLPPILIEAELETMIAEMKHEVGRMGIPFDQYLTHLKKSEVELKAEWGDQATRRVKTGLILAEIARAEKLEAPKEELEHELKHLIEQHPEASADGRADRARAYLASLIVNEQVFKLLEAK